MSVPLTAEQPYRAVRRYVRGWDRHLRLDQSLRWLPRALAFAFGLGAVVAFVSRVRPWLLTEQVIQLTFVLAVIICGATVAAVWLYPRSLIKAARRFDRLFQLHERTSTAIELLTGQIRANDIITERQIADALQSAEAVRVQQHLPLRPRWKDWGLALALLVLLALLLLLPNPQAASVEAENAQSAAIEAAADALREITRDIAANPNLSDEEREQLLQALEATSNALDQPDVTPEEALAAVSNAEVALQDQSQQLREQVTNARSGLTGAADALRNLPSLQDQVEDASLSDMLSRLSEQAGNLNDAERSAAADALEQAAEAAGQASNAAAEAMQQAADNLRQNDVQSAQQNLEQAQQGLEQANAEAQQAEQSAQSLEAAAERAQQAGDQVTEPQESGQSSSSPQESQGQSASSEPQEQPGQQPGQQPGSGQAGSSSGEDAGQPQSQAGQSSQQGGGSQADQQSSSQDSGAPSSQQQGQGEAGEGSAMSGAGDAPGNSGQEQSSGGPQQQPDGNNNPDGLGESSFEPVYAPIRIGGEAGDTEIQLEPDTSDMPVTEGEFAQNPEGQVTVPYDQVFSDYADAANRALESDYVPLGLRDVVRDYFSSIEPGQSGR